MNSESRDVGLQQILKKRGLGSFDLLKPGVTDLLNQIDTYGEEAFGTGVELPQTPSVVSEPPSGSRLSPVPTSTTHKAFRFVCRMAGVAIGGEDAPAVVKYILKLLFAGFSLSITYLCLILCFIDSVMLIPFWMLSLAEAHRNFIAELHSTNFYNVPIQKKYPNDKVRQTVWTPPYGAGWLFNVWVAILRLWQGSAKVNLLESCICYKHGRTGHHLKGVDGSPKRGDPSMEVEGDVNQRSFDEPCPTRGQGLPEGRGSHSVPNSNRRLLSGFSPKQYNTHFRQFLSNSPPPTPVAPNDALYNFDTTERYRMQLSMLFVTRKLNFTIFKKHFAKRWLSWEPKMRSSVSRRWGRKVWVSDKSFNIDEHIRYVQVDLATTTLAEVVTQMADHKLDRSKPQWELWFLETTHTGNDMDSYTFVISKWDHIYADGVGIMCSIVNRLADEQVSFESLPASYKTSVPKWQIFLFKVYNVILAAVNCFPFLLHLSFNFPVTAPLWPQFTVNFAENSALKQMRKKFYSHRSSNSMMSLVKKLDAENAQNNTDCNTNMFDRLINVNSDGSDSIFPPCEQPLVIPVDENVSNRVEEWLNCHHVPLGSGVRNDLETLPIVADPFGTTVTQHYSSARLFNREELRDTTLALHRYINDRVESDVREMGDSWNVDWLTKKISKPTINDLLCYLLYASLGELQDKRSSAKLVADILQIPLDAEMLDLILNPHAARSESLLGDAKRKMDHILNSPAHISASGSSPRLFKITAGAILEGSEGTLVQKRKCSQSSTILGNHSDTGPHTRVQHKAVGGLEATKVKAMSRMRERMRKRHNERMNERNKKVREVRYINAIIPMMCRTELPQMMNNQTSMIPVRIPVPFYEEDKSLNARVKDLVTVKECFDRVKRNDWRFFVYYVFYGLCKALPFTIARAVYHFVYRNMQFSSTNVAAPPIDSTFCGHNVEGLFFWPAVPSSCPLGSSWISLGNDIQVLMLTHDTEMAAGIRMADDILAALGLGFTGEGMRALSAGLSDALPELMLENYAKLRNQLAESGYDRPVHHISKVQTDDVSSDIPAIPTSQMTAPQATLNPAPVCSSEIPLQANPDDVNELPLPLFESVTPDDSNVPSVITAVNDSNEASPVEPLDIDDYQDENEKPGRVATDGNKVDGTDLPCLGTPENENEEAELCEKRVNVSNMAKISQSLMYRRSA